MKEKEKWIFYHSPCSTLILQCVSQNFWQTVSKVCFKFPKFAPNLAISFRSCQSICELGNEVVNFTPNFIEKFMPNFFGKLTSWQQEKFPSFGEIVSEFPYTLWLHWLGITSFKMGIKRGNWIFPDVIRHLPKNRVQFLSHWFILG